MKRYLLCIPLLLGFTAHGSQKSQPRILEQCRHTVRKALVPASFFVYGYIIGDHRQKGDYITPLALTCYIALCYGAKKLIEALYTSYREEEAEYAFIEKYTQQRPIDK